MNKKSKDNNLFNISYKILIFSCFLVLLPNKIFAYENKILFKINNNIITTVDIINEINYLKLLNEDFKNFENDKIYKIAKNSIIKDVIREDELKTIFKKIELDEIFIEKFALEYFSKLNFNSLKDLENFLIKSNLKLD